MKYQKSLLLALGITLIFTVGLWMYSNSTVEKNTPIYSGGDGLFSKSTEKKGLFYSPNQTEKTKVKFSNEIGTEFYLVPIVFIGVFLIGTSVYKD